MPFPVRKFAEIDGLPLHVSEHGLCHILLPYRIRRIQCSNQRVLITRIPALLKLAC
jgi:hypothetical protein